MIKIEFNRLRKRMVKLVLYFFIFLVLLVVYLKWFEKTKIFYPTRTIEVTPKTFGINYKDIFFKTKDNIKLNGWLCLKDKNLVTILYCHGNAGNISHRLDVIKNFFEEGFNVFIFDWRGYGLSEGRPSEEGLYTDVISAYEYLLNDLGIPADKIIVYGESLGTAAAIFLAKERPVKLLILNGAFSCGLDMAKTLFPYLPRFFLKLILSARFDSLSRIKKINIPKLFIHSREDEIVPFKLANKLFESANPPKEFYIKKGFHNEALYLDKTDILKIKDFIEKYFNQKGF